MRDILFGYYLTRFEVLVILFLVGGAGVAIYWGIRRQWRSRLETLEQKLADAHLMGDSEHFQALYGHLQSAVAHEFVKGLDYIANKSAETLEGLAEAQNVLRDKQDRIIVKAHELTQHAENILDVFALERKDLQKELLSIRQLVEHVVLEFFRYAQSKGVTLRLNLADVEPTVLNRNLTLQALKNVIGNAIKYSFPGGVAGITLSLDGDEGTNPGKVICVEVKDTGKGIPEEDQDKIFELRVRGEGLIEPGSGLGLYLARRAARRQGGDVILVRSGLNKGSVFKIILPYSGE
jgi:signal transduction histidine kinase